MNRIRIVLGLIGWLPLVVQGHDQLFTLERTVAHSGFDGNLCWVHPRAGAIPAGTLGNPAAEPLVVMTMQKLPLSGSDVFYALHETRLQAAGAGPWSEPVPLEGFRRQRFDASTPAGLPTGGSLAPELLRDGDETTVCDFTPKWHRASQRMLGIGQTVWYRENRVMDVRPRGIAYSVRHPQSQQWSAWKTLELPPLPEFQSAGSGSAQRVDLLGGDVLVPFYFKQPAAQQYSVAVARCRFDGHTLEYVRHGNTLTIPVKRGLYEPSLTKFGTRYYLTLRNDDHGYVSHSEDGLHFTPPRRWTFDDGTDLGSYNTQQHWVTHHAGLFLVYTRRGADNDHVFRHRAPLFIARVDPETLQVRRATEQILVPEHGARLGNFGVVDVSADETWVTVAEWMQPPGVSRFGSENRIFVVRLKWKGPSQLGPAPARRPRETRTGKEIQAYFAPPAAFRDKLGTYASPLVSADGTRVTTPAGWARRRAEIVAEWQELLGAWPPLITEPDVEILETERRGSLVQHRIRFRWTPTEFTTGYLLVPNAPGKHPAVITVYYEPETAIGRGRPHRDFAFQLGQRGFVTLSLGTTQASAKKTYALYYPSIQDAQVAPLSMLAYAAANAWHVLARRRDVDAERIGIMGHSFGGKWAMFASCLFDKFACAAWSDAGIVFDETRANVNYWEPWYLGYHPQPWRPRGVITAENPSRGLYPRLVQAGHDLHELHALMPPRPFLVSGGAEDPLPRWAALNHTVQVNRLLGVEQRVAMTNRADHAPNQDSNEVVYRFFEHFLRPAADAAQAKASRNVAAP